MVFRAALSWMALLLIAILNGGVRESLLVPRMSPESARAASTLLLSALIGGLGWICTPWIGPRTLQQAWGVGIGWVTLTLGFEFLAGHFVFGKPWSELLADYNVLAGRIWVLVLLVTVLTPPLVFVQRQP